MISPAEIARMIRDYFDLRSRDIIIGCVAKIERHDLPTMKADVKPLLQFTAAGNVLADDYEILPQIPVQILYAGGYFIRPEYKRGDLVWVTFATYGIEDALSGQPQDTAGPVFSLAHASVANGLLPKTFVPGPNWTNAGLIVGHEVGTQLEVSQTKFKFFFSEGNFTEISPTGLKVTLGGIAYDFVPHTHMSVGETGPTNPAAG